MARPLRIEYSSAIYHVLSRGDRREAIFRTDADRKLFLDLLGQTNGQAVTHRVFGRNLSCA
jgi:REP-associated tyrosine transposase